MKFKKGILLTALTLATISVMGTFSNVQAAVDSKTLSIKALRKSGYGYQVVNNSTKYIWKIYDTNYDYNDTFYCIKGGPGFGSGTIGTIITPTQYTKQFNLKNPESIPEKYLTALPDTTGKNYARLLWVLDQCYIAPTTNASDTEKQIAVQNRKQLLEAVENYVTSNKGVPTYKDKCEIDDIGQFPDEETFQNHKVTYHLTDDDIDAIQQLAVWYYTNDSDDYHVEGDPSIYINKIINVDGNYGPLNNGNIDTSRAHAINALYAYLTQTPKPDDFTYDYANSESNASTVKFANTEVAFERTEERVIVGPYKIEELRNINYSLGFSLTDGDNNPIEDVILLDGTKNAVVEGTTLNDLVGENFYISIPSTTNTTNIKFKINGVFYTTKVTYWSVENPSEVDQPVVLLEKVKRTFEVSKENGEEPEIPEEPEFDLALRKFITSVKGVELTGEDSREPKISEETLRNLANGGTLTTQKVHTKDPIAINKGDKVVYTIRVYNEGEVDGWATQVTDYLPEGLKFVPASESEINNTYGWEVSEDGKTVTTNYLASDEHKLVAFNKETLELDHEDLKIECQVVGPVSQNDKTLKNIAEITGNKDINGKTDADLDRDSQTGNVTTNPERYNPQDPTKGLGEQDDDDYEDLLLEGKYFDLSLRKFIAGVTNPNSTSPNVVGSREPVVDVSPLLNGQKTAIYNHTKEPVAVYNRDIVTYTIRVYNEGQLDGYVTKITDHLPKQLEFIADDELNIKYGWTVDSEDGRTVSTDITSPETENSANRDDIFASRETGSDTDKVLLKAFDGEKLDYIDVQIRCRVKDNIDLFEKITNIAEISGFTDSEGNVVKDRDSQKENVTLPTDETLPEYKDTEIERGDEYIPGQQDDDDFEKLVLKRFDLALRKFITGVTNPNSTSPNGLGNREPVVDVSPLLNGQKTAIYNHTKEPVAVSNGDIVTYTIRVYNEGQVDGYVTKITDHLPKQLEFIVDDELNAKYGWTVESRDGRTVSTDITSPETENSASRDAIFASRETGSDTDKVLLKAFDGEKLDYIDVQIRCRVKDDIDLFEKITNIAEISGFTDSEGSAAKDRDSQEENVTLPTDETLPAYKDTEIERGDKYIPGQQDDDDFEKLVLQRFDLALRKFITGVVSGETTTDITDRVPIFTKVNDKQYKYEHPKDPVEVANTNIVIYTLRIFNEGNVAGYASKVKDDLPEGLEFLPENSVNTAFNWKMYKEDGTETQVVEEAKYIETDFLSKDKEQEEGSNLIKAFDPETMTMPDYKDLKIAFKVTLPNTSDRIVINQAQISDDSDEDGKPIDDVDSKTNEWNEGEDDQDIEKIKVKYFDLSLKKWVTESIVTIDGKTTVTKSGHTGDENPEPPMKVEIPNGKLNNTTVKFRFNIKVTNEGEIAGYATELIDYIPEGLKFVAEDNPKWQEVDGKVVTDQLKDTLLQPEESATVEIVLTWINGKDNMGEKVNWAEINKDKNEYDSPDVDSTPGNDVKEEDDIDRAPVVLSPATGKAQTYVALILSCVTITAGGVFLIKKFVI